jgi:type I restriction enzyme M protein
LSNIKHQADNIVGKIWALCNVLRGDGISYHQYISELTYLLFLKVAKENGSEDLLPIGYRWDDLKEYKGSNLLGFYQEMLTHLGATATSKLVRDIYAFPTTVFSHSENLKVVIEGVEKIN